jgi:hypothetical protein
MLQRVLSLALGHRTGLLLSTCSFNMLVYETSTTCLSCSFHDPESDSVGTAGWIAGQPNSSSSTYSAVLQLCITSRPIQSALLAAQQHLSQVCTVYLVIKQTSALCGCSVCACWGAALQQWQQQGMLPQRQQQQLDVAWQQQQVAYIRQTAIGSPWGCMTLDLHLGWHVGKWRLSVDNRGRV